MKKAAAFAAAFFAMGYEPGAMSRRKKFAKGKFYGVQ